MVSHVSGMNNAASNFGSSVFYLILVTFLSFWTWYRPIYQAFVKNSGLQYSNDCLLVLFFTFNGFHIVFNGYMLLGFPGSGGAGLINMMAMFSDSKIFAGLVCGASSFLWLTALIFWLALWRKTHYVYREFGHSVEKTQGEAVELAVTSGALQGMATSSLKSTRI
jgi:hypothetical protein